MNSRHAHQARLNSTIDRPQIIWKRCGLVLTSLLITLQLVACGGGSSYSSPASSSSSVSSSSSSASSSSSSSSSSAGVTLSNAFPQLAAFTAPVMAMQAAR